MSFYPLRCAVKFIAGGGANADLARLGLPEKRKKARRSYKVSYARFLASATSGVFE